MVSEKMDFLFCQQDLQSDNPRNPPFAATCERAVHRPASQFVAPAPSLVAVRWRTRSQIFILVEH